MPTLSDAVADWVGNEILHGRWSAGRRVTELEIAEALGVSRQPVREALRVLNEQGLILLKPRVGAVVATFDSATIRNIYETRIVLESWIIRQAISNLDDSAVPHVEAWRELLSIPLEVSREDYVNRAWRYRSSLYAYCANPVAIGVVEDLRKRIRSLPRILQLDPGYLDGAVQFARELLQAFESRDAEVAVEVVSERLRSNCEILQDRFDQSAGSNQSSSSDRSA